MAINYTRLGAGTLSVGTVPLDISAQVVGALLTSSLDTGDMITVLTGEQLGSGSTTTASLTGSIILDPKAGGIGEFSYQNHGQIVPFVFTPNTAAGITATGELTMTKLDIGATEYGALLQPDFEWAVVGEPVVVWGTAA